MPHYLAFQNGAAIDSTTKIMDFMEHFVNLNIANFKLLQDLGLSDFSFHAVASTIILSLSNVEKRQFFSHTYQIPVHRVHRIKYIWT